MFIIHALLCVLVLSKALASRKYDCLLNPDVCDPLIQLCVNDGTIGKCVLKQQVWLSASQPDYVRDEPIFPNGNLYLNSDQLHRLSVLLRQTKKFIRSKHVELSDLSDAQLDEIANAIVRIFFLQEKDARAAEQSKLEAYLREIGRGHLIDRNDLKDIEKKLKEKDPVRSNNVNQQYSSFGKSSSGNVGGDIMLVQSDENQASDVSGTSENSSYDSRKFIAVSPRSSVGLAKNEPAHHTGRSKEATYIIVIVVLLVVVLCIAVIAVVVYCMKSAQARNKLLGSASTRSGDDYQALCRQHYASKSSEKPETKQPLIPKTNITTSGRLFSPTSHHHPLYKGSRNSSQSSWSEEPITTTLDISTGHTVLAYMEDHLNNKGRLEQEWEALCAYKAENVSTKIAGENPSRNRSQCALPYDHNRVKLATDNDYINASYIIDNDPRWPVYIAAQGPLSSTVHHFWQMIWEQGCVVIVMLTPLMEEGSGQCARYWPDEGSSTYNDYEIHLVSEHIWCEDYLVRSLYLKNLLSGQTRTVTQFHFLSWPAEGVPPSTKQLLELRRKVSKCYRGNALSPVLVHCSDGCGRTGSYMLLDLVITRMVKGTCKEIDIAATLEHLRDQRAGPIVATKDQLEFVLACVADEVNAILKVLLQ